MSKPLSIPVTSDPKKQQVISQDSAAYLLLIPPTHQHTSNPPTGANARFKLTTPASNASPPPWRLASGGLDFSAASESSSTESFGIITNCCWLPSGMMLICYVPVPLGPCKQKLGEKKRRNQSSLVFNPAISPISGYEHLYPSRACCSQMRRDINTVIKQAVMAPYRIDVA